MSGCSNPTSEAFAVPPYETNCTGGKVWNGSACVCPTGTQEYNGQCMTPEQICAAKGGHWYNGQCTICPSGTTWNGSQCVTPVSKPGSPSAPQEIAQSATGTGYNASLTILWTPGGGATSQDVINPNNGQVFKTGLSGTANEYTITGLYAGATTHVAIRANNSAGSITGPATAFVLPCPAGYTQTGGGCQQNIKTPGMPSAFDCSSYESSNLSTEVDMCWNIDSNVQYYIVRASSGFGGGLNGPGQSVGYQGIVHLTGAQPDTTIQAQVAGVNSAGQGPWSAVVTMRTQRPTPVQSISARDCSSGQYGCINCCFSGVPSNAAEVTIQHVDGSGNVLGTLKDYVIGNSVQICGLYPGGIENWQVRAYSSSGALVAYSNIVQSTAGSSTAGL